MCARREQRRKATRSLLVALIVGGLWLAQAGAETVFEDTPVPPIGAEGGPASDLTVDEVEQWKRGRTLFDRDWHLDQGLGTPELNADSCRACHEDPALGGAGGLDVNVFRYGFDDDGVGPFADLDGGQVASRLRRPDTAGRDEHVVTADVFEQRQTPSIFGAGLIDSIFESEILANEDPDDLDGDGIQGIARLIDVDGELEVGRFGWKSQIPTLRDFVRDALGGETGITVPDDGRGFGMLTDDDVVADPEVTEEDIDDMAFYLGQLAAPPRRGATPESIEAGETHFDEIGCADCHIPSLEGEDGPVELYSDLLLHDVLPDDFRGMAEEGAGVGLYRTPPLWGISRTAPYMHDGRAETVEDAILAHDGEALDAREAYEDLTAEEQVELLLFLADL